MSRPPSPDEFRGFRHPRGWLPLALLLVLLLCASGGLGLALAPALAAADAAASTPTSSPGIVARGHASGPLPGLGPRLEWAAWLREQRQMRADLHFDGPVGPVHEVLVWTPEAAVLFDRRHLRYTRLGARAGSVEGLGGEFQVGELWWILLGTQERELLPEVAWQLQEGQWRGKAPGKGYRRPAGSDPAWVEVLWRDAADQTHVLRAWRERTRDCTWGKLATRLDLEGSDLEGRVRVRFENLQARALGDSILDPVWEPRRD